MKNKLSTLFQACFAISLVLALAHPASTSGQGLAPGGSVIYMPSILQQST